MACVRCGYCCATMFIITISPKYSHIETIDEFNQILEKEDTLTDDLLISITNQDNKICPYLSWDNKNDISVCKIHHKEWFKLLPCHNYRKELKCNIGPMFIEKSNQMKDYIKNRIKSYS